MSELDPIIQETMEEVRKVRELKGHCTFQMEKDGVRYCTRLHRIINPHAYCPFLSQEKIIIVESDVDGNPQINSYYKSTFVPKGS